MQKMIIPFVWRPKRITALWKCSFGNPYTGELKRKGYGKILLDFSLERAASLGYGAVLFESNLDFYGKSGFTYARSFGIRYHDLPEDADDSFFLCKELTTGYLLCGRCGCGSL